MDKKQILEKFFNNEISPKSLRKFKQKTPKGNFVSGWINLEPGEYLSSMILTKIETKDQVIRCNRFIRGMPKQHYYDKELWDLEKNEDFTIYYCDEKLDGTCLILYTLYDDKDNLIEIVPRTRGMAVAANHILDLYNLVDQAQIEEFYNYPHNYDTSLFFELHGILNRHEITNHKYYIDISLIGASCDREVLPYKEVLSIAYHHHFETPDRLFELCFYNGHWSIWPVSSRLYPYYTKNLEMDNKFETLSDCIEGLTNIIEGINNNYKEKNNHIAIEGVVINGLDPNGNQRYVKIKPWSVLRMAKLGNGIPQFAIRKEVYKYFDEYGPIKVKEIYNEDKLHFVKFVQENLKEEFPEEFVEKPKTVKKINNVFFSVWEAKMPSLNIHQIAENLATQYSDKDISEVMRIFAREYPAFKNKSRQIYSILTYLIKDGD